MTGADQTDLFAGEATSTGAPEEEGVRCPDIPTGGAPLHRLVGREALWLALHLWRWPLDVMRREASRSGHGVVVVDKDRVLAADERAAAAGVTAGMSAGGAYALLPSVTLLQRDPEREQRMLRWLGAGMYRYSSCCSLEAPDGVALEIGGSLKLFGGLERMLQRLREELEEEGLAARMAVAPTAMAALWFSRSRFRVVPGRSQLAAAFASLPLSALRWESGEALLLENLGLRTVADCLRLPRSGLARRLGPRRLLELDQALGRAPELRSAFVPEQRFRSHTDLPLETADSRHLLAAMAVLLQELQFFLRGRQAAVQRLEFRFHHLREPPSKLRLDCARPDNDPAYFLSLLEERLRTWRPAAGTVALSVQSGRLERPNGERHGSLLAQGGRRAGEEAVNVPDLVERLQARLGEDAVRGLCLIAEHRPEAAWCYRRPLRDGTKRRTESGASGNYLLHRPLWMLHQPLLLESRHGLPVYGGGLAPESGPERIETGWWDGCEVARDYYVFSHPDGMRLWIFRERTEKGRWFLHGLFA